jgi:predicted nucleotidyltransferase
MRPGESVSFEDRNDLLEKLDRLDQPIPARHEGRTTAHREHSVMLRYLRYVGAGEGLLALPMTLRKHPEGEDRPPDFMLEWPGDRRETFELTDGSTEEYQKRLSAASADEDSLILPVDINTREREAADLWAEILFAAYLKKAEALVAGRFSLDHLLIYDLTGLGLLLPLERGAPNLRMKLQQWYQREKPSHRFGRVTVVRDLGLLLDVESGGRVLREESPYYQLPVIRAHGEEDLKQRLRAIDRYCRENSIRHLKAFGSILGDTLTSFREESDLDLLVEFEPGARVTLLDMARMERALGELTGFKVDLRTAGDLSRYFRQEILETAVELDAAQG